MSDRVYTLVACDGCQRGFRYRDLAEPVDGVLLCKACFDAWLTENEQEATE